MQYVAFFEAGVPLFPLALLFREPPSVASLFALYSIRFCSKFGSSRYSCKAPANDTGAFSKGDVSVQQVL